MKRCALPYVLFLFLGACVDSGGQETGGKTPEDSAAVNIAPSASITSHLEGDTVREGDLVTLKGTVADEGAAAGELRAAWTVAGVEACPAAAPNEYGETTCEVRFLPDGGAVVLDVVDPEGATGQASVMLTVTATDAPVAAILAPEAAGLHYYNNIPVALAGQVSDAEDAPTALTVAWEDSVAGALTGLATAPAADGSLAESYTFAEGEHLLSLLVTDTDGKQARASVNFVVRGDNQAPSCGITAPSSGTAGVAGSIVRFAGNAADADVSAAELTATWSSDLDGLLGGGAVASDGTITLDLDTLSIGTHVVQLVVADEVGAVCSDTVTFTVGTPPELVVLAPVSGDIYNDGELIAFSAVVADGEDVPAALYVEWTSDVDGVFNTDVADASGALDFGAVLTAGDHVVTVTVTDTAGFTDVEVLDLTVNALPSAPTVALSPDPATTDDDLLAAASGSVDPDGSGAVTYAYAWYVDGVLSAASTSDTLPASATTKHETWTVVVTPNDGGGDGASASAALTIANSAPVLSGPTVSASVAQVGDELRCTATATDADADAVSLTYAWTDSTGSLLASTDAYVVDSASNPGEVLTCTVTADDGDGGVVTGSDRATVANTAPELGSVSVTPATGAVGDSFVCSATATDADGGTPTITFEWTVSGISVGSGTTYTANATDTDPGDTLTCTATADDGDGGTDTGAATASIANTAPVMGTVAVSPTSGNVGDTFTCSGSATDADGGSPTLSYAWTVDGTPIASGSSYTATAADTDPGDTLTCTVTADDGDGGAATAAASASIGNSAPVLSAAVVTPATAAVGDTFVCSASATDADATAPTLTYVWTLGGSTLATGSSYTVTAADTDPGDVVTCTVTATDGEGATDSATATGTVLNTAPVLSGVSVSPSTAAVGGVFTCAASATDADGGAPTLAYAWTVGASAVGSGSSYTVTAADTAPGDTVTCTVTASDTAGGTDTGTDTGTVLDTLPTAPTVSISPAAPEAGVDDLVCAASGSTDADAQTVTYAAAWTVDGVAFAGATTTVFSGDTVDAANTNEGEVWTCTVTPTAGGASGSTGNDSVTIESSLADLIVDGTTVTLTAGSYEYDDVEVINGGQLIVDGDVIVNANTLFVESGSTVSGDGWGPAGGTTTSRTGSGSGGGTGSSSGGGGGGSHAGTGGTGGKDSSDTPGVGGSTYGSTSSASVGEGSGGGGTDVYSGGAGGAAFTVFAEDIVVDGTITMDGSSGVGGSRSGGGGSGGGILLVGMAVEVTGSLTATGGTGGSGTSTANDGGGGGGGGRIKLYTELPLVMTGSYSVAGGAGGRYGDTYGTAGGVGAYTTGTQAWP